MIGRLTPQERIGLAKNLHKRANGQPGLKIKQRQELRRHVSNLVALNMIDAKRKKSD